MSTLGSSLPLTLLLVSNIGAGFFLCRYLPALRAWRYRLTKRYAMNAAATTASADMMPNTATSPVGAFFLLLSESAPATVEPSPELSPETVTPMALHAWEMGGVFGELMGASAGSRGILC